MLAGAVPVGATDGAAGVLCCSTGTGTGADMPIAAMLVEVFFSVLTFDTLRMSMIGWRLYERIVIPNLSLDASQTGVSPTWFDRALRLSAYLSASGAHLRQRPEKSS